MSKRSAVAARRWRPWRILGWGAAAFILLLPLVAMQFTDEVDWGSEDFLFAAVLLGITGLSAECVVRLARNDLTRVAAGLALGGGLLLIWVNAAVGIIGSDDNQANAMYLAVLATGVIGALIARFRARGMVIVMGAIAIVQTVVTLIALIGRLGLPATTPLELLAINGFFIALWLASAALFRRGVRAAQPQCPLFRRTDPAGQRAGPAGVQGALFTRGLAGSARD